MTRTAFPVLDVAATGLADFRAVVAGADSLGLASASTELALVAAGAVVAFAFLFSPSYDSPLPEDVAVSFFGASLVSA